MSHLIAAFESSTTLELALVKLEQNGIKQEDIIAIPLDQQRNKETMSFNTIHRSDGKSLLDIACITGMIFMLLGAIYGFILYWGPIIWGLIGLIFGFLLGLLLDFLLTKEKSRKKGKNQAINVFLTIRCKENQKEMIERILWDHYALGIGKLDKNNNEIRKRNA